MLPFLRNRSPASALRSWRAAFSNALELHERHLNLKPTSHSILREWLRYPDGTDVTVGFSAFVNHPAALWFGLFARQHYRSE